VGEIFPDDVNYLKSSLSEIERFPSSSPFLFFKELARQNFVLQNLGGLAFWTKFCYSIFR